MILLYTFTTYNMKQIICFQYSDKNVGIFQKKKILKKRKKKKKKPEQSSRGSEAEASRLQWLDLRRSMIQRWILLCPLLGGMK